MEGKGMLLLGHRVVWLHAKRRYCLFEEEAPHLEVASSKVGGPISAPYLKVRPTYRCLPSKVEGI